MTAIPAQLHDEYLLTTEQVAAITGLSKRALEGWRHRKEGPKYIELNPKVVRYRWADLRAFLAARTITTAAA